MILINTLISIFCGIFAVCLSLLTLSEAESKKVKIFDMLSENIQRESKEPSRVVKAILSVGVAVFSAIAVFRVLGGPINIMDKTEIILVLFPVLAAGWIDLRENRIPNTISLFLLICGIVFLAIHVFSEPTKYEIVLMSRLGACVGSFVIFALLGLVFRMGIGGGDIKLVCVLGLCRGVFFLISTLFIGTLVCAIVAVFLLVFKKKSLKSTLPYGPFILFGYIVSMLISQLSI